MGRLNLPRQPFVENNVDGSQLLDLDMDAFTKVRRQAAGKGTRGEKGTGEMGKGRVGKGQRGGWVREKGPVGGREKRRDRGCAAGALIVAVFLTRPRAVVLSCCFFFYRFWCARSGPWPEAAAGEASHAGHPRPVRREHGPAAERAGAVHRRHGDALRGPPCRVPDHVLAAGRGSAADVRRRRDRAASDDARAGAPEHYAARQRAHDICHQGAFPDIGHMPSKVSEHSGNTARSGRAEHIQLSWL